MPVFRVLGFASRRSGRSKIARGKGFANFFYTRPDGEVHPIDSHSLIATDSQDNREALRDVLREVIR